ncbi:MAG: esterase/lipase family protein [Wenzhouxiangella sp.]
MPTSKSHMARPAHLHPSDLQGLARLAVEGVIGTTSLVEQLHHTIARVSPPLGKPREGTTSGITGLVYRSIHGITGAVGGATGLAFDAIVPRLGRRASTPQREQILATLNGVLGDHLDASANPLAIGMRLRQAGRPLELRADKLNNAIQRPRRKLLVALHGLCMNDLQWAGNAEGSDPGLPASLASTLDYTPLFLHYNTGRHISTNGRAFAALMEQLIDQWPAPVEEIVLLGHSMGGLLARSALHYAQAADHQWHKHVSRLVTLGSPHHGAPLERIGNRVDRLLAASPYSAPFTRLGRIRSAGITDLRHGNLLDEDWNATDRFSQPGDQRGIVKRPGHIVHHVVAATTGTHAESVRSRLIGDGLVTLDSALGRHPDPRLDLDIPPELQSIAWATNHLGLIHCPEVRETVYRWLARAR